MFSDAVSAFRKKTQKCNNVTCNIVTIRWFHFSQMINRRVQRYRCKHARRVKTAVYRRKMGNGRRQEVGCERPQVSVSEMANGAVKSHK